VNGVERGESPIGLAQRSIQWRAVQPLADVEQEHRHLNEIAVNLVTTGE
jgi:hypothetical protein